MKGARVLERLVSQYQDQVMEQNDVLVTLADGVILLEKDKEHQKLILIKIEPSQGHLPLRIQDILEGR